MKEVEIVIPSSPADRKAIADVMKDMSNAMARAEGEQTYISEAIKGLKDKYNIDAKYLRRLLTDFHKDQKDKVIDETEQYSDLFDAVFRTKAPEQSDGNDAGDGEVDLSDEAA